ncbi:hypothetical protein HC928_10620 [bacterium]|nr:hypothetical protein [bacterium]
MSGILNVAGDEILSLTDLALLMGKVLDKQVVLRYLDKPSGKLLGDNTAMKRNLGILPEVSLTEGLKNVCEDLMFT